MSTFGLIWVHLLFVGRRSGEDVYVALAVLVGLLERLALFIASAALLLLVPLASLSHIRRNPLDRRGLPQARLDPPDRLHERSGR